LPNFIPTVVVSIIVFDQISKALAVKFLPTVCNLGFAFGVFPFSNLLSTVLIIVILVSIAILFLNQKGQSFALALILGGGFSNLVDRLIRGCVVDFVKWPVFANLPAFNLADAAITVGVVLLILNIIKRR